MTTSPEKTEKEPMDIYKNNQEYEGFCPCVEAKVKGIRIAVHCWRTKLGCDCPFSGVHVYGGNKNLADEILKSVKERWGKVTEFALVSSRREKNKKNQ